MKYTAFLLFIALMSNACSAANPAPPDNPDGYRDRDQKKKAPTLQQKLQAFTAPYKATVGISIRALDGSDSVTLNNTRHYATMSTYKFPLGLAVIERVRKNELSLEQRVRVTKEQMHPGTYSPMRDKYPEGNVELTIGELLYYAVSLSDNNATDVLFGLMGGTAPVEQYIHGLGFTEMAIRATEYEMGEEGKLYDNWSTPWEMSRLLAYAFSEGPQDEPFHYLAKLMTESPTGKLRLKGLLPPGTKLSHKTGTSGANEQGITTAVNDVGVLCLPDGKQLAIAVFVSDSKESFETNEYIIAKVAQIVYAHYTRNYEPASRGLDLTDAARNRKIPVQIYESLWNNGKVVILSGGYLSERTDYSFIANDLARKGYLVISVQHDVEGDAPMAQKGNIYKLRKPIWERGIASIDYVVLTFKGMYPNRDFDKLVLIGHSNGGDISMLLATQQPERVTAVVSLDHRRMPMPRTDKVKQLSIRSTDFEADKNVLPTAAEQQQYGIVILQPAEAKHGDLCDRGSAELKQEILAAIHTLLAETD